MNKTEAVRAFLHAAPGWVAKMYTPDMEVQVNVAKDEGEIITGTQPRPWRGFSDGVTTWKHFRIPWNAKTNPRYEDRKITFNLFDHAEAIGMTGWDWRQRRSRWVGFDFDSIVGHKGGLTGEELNEIQTKLKSCPFCFICTSTSGSGLHIYVFITDDTTIATHTEHAAVARAVLDKISSTTGLRLEAKVDVLGGNMWVWHRKANEKSFEVLHVGHPLEIIPANWENYLSVVDKKKVTEQTTTDESLFVASQRQINLDKQHLTLLAWFEKQTCLWWWDANKNMLVCHTFDLARAYKELDFRGLFETLATGADDEDQNCFCFPKSGGTWSVHRHTKGVTEAPTWFTSASGWTTCYLGRVPTLKVACQQVDAIEGEKEYTFESIAKAGQALAHLGINCTVPDSFNHRPAYLKYTLDGKITVAFEAVDADSAPDGWLKKKGQWTKIFFNPNVVDDIELPDEVIRHLIAGDRELGWWINSSRWIAQSKSNVMNVMLALGYKRPEIDNILGRCILNYWEEVSLPFQPEYPGNRCWNKRAPQFRFDPKKGKHENWDLILQHIGTNLDEYVRKNEWCQINGIVSGYSYLQTWVSSLVQYPMQPLPYLTLTGSQNCGKSILHEALSLLFTGGIIRADNALTNPSGFNGELAGAILCVVEETNLSKRGYAADRIKDWVTGRTISIRELYNQPRDMINYTHWIQCTNDPSYCPVFMGDTRITVINIDSLKDEVPKPALLERCEKEAPAFLYTILNKIIPESEGRLRIPVLDTAVKQVQMEASKSEVELFVADSLEKGGQTNFSELYSSFLSWVGHVDASNWNNRRFAKELRKLRFTLDKRGQGGALHLIGWKINE